MTSDNDVLPDMTARELIVVVIGFVIVVCLIF